MNCESFSRKTVMHHDLDGGLALDSAPERDFGINYAIYRNVNPEFDEFLDYGSDLEGLNYCFWVLQNGEKVGGIIIRPNHIEGLFLRPPHANACEVLQAVMPLLRSWSDKTKEIEAVGVMPRELELYQRLGFTLSGARRVYVRTTESFDIHWEDGYDVATPMAAHSAEVAGLFQVGYRDYPGQWALAKYSLQDWVCRMEKRLAAEDVPEVCNRASTLVYDRAHELLIGACIVRLSRSIVRPDVCYAKVADISVHPEYRRRGLGSRMLKTALTALHGEFTTLKFGVAVGNPAEAFYYSLGFLPGVAQHKLRIPAGASGTPAANDMGRRA